jgi:hypothetical protein
MLAAIERDGMSPLLGIERLRPAAALAAACPGSDETRPRPLADERAFELGEGCEQMEGEFAVDRSRVDALGQ